MVRLLLVRLSHLGDVIHALPVFHAMRETNPDARIGWVVQPEFASVLEELDGLDEIVPFERRGGAGAWLRLRGRLAAFGADRAVDAQANWKSAAVLLASGAPRRSGPHRADWREPLACLAANDRAPRPAAGPHAVDRMRALTEHVAPDAAWHPGGPRLPIGAERLARGRAELAARVGRADAPVLVALGRARDPRSWSARHVADCANALVTAGRRVLVLSGPAEADLGDALARRLERPGVAHWVGQRGLGDLAGLFAAAAERGGRLLANDSGPAHLACAVGLPVTCLAGPQDAARTGPWPSPSPTSPHEVLRAEREPRCAPCLARRCYHPEGPVCMERIDSASVVESLLRSAPERAARS